LAKICSVIAMSHSPFMFQDVEWWDATNSKRSYAAGMPRDGAASNLEKHRKIQSGLSAVRDIFQESRPDVVLVFGDDQDEQFDFNNHPPFAVYVGGRFEGYKAVRYAGELGSRDLKPKTEEHWTAVDSYPGLATAVLQGLMQHGFDPAFMKDLPKRDVGMGHAFMRPMGPLTDGRFDVPMVPILVNCLYAPQPSAARCVAVARAVRRSVEAWPEDIRVAVVGSGGLWHTPGAPEAYLDEAFDQAILERLCAGDADGMAEYFDTWAPKPEVRNLKCFSRFDGGTGMAGGIGSGTGEVRNWIMAAAVADRPGTLVDYIPVYASPCGIGFAYWKLS
jgi:hypothetical protein